MNPYLILVPILIPIVFGAALLFLPRWSEKRRNIYTFLIACVTSAITLLLLFCARRETVSVYSFIQGFAICFRVDGMALIFAGMVSLMWPPALLYAYEYMEGERAQASFFAFYLMTYGVALGVAFSANLVTMYVFFEMLTLVTLPLVTHYQNRESLFAGRLYILYCIAGAAMGFIAVVLATLDGAGEFRYGGSIGKMYSPDMMRTIYLFGFFGFGTKAAIFPLFEWLPKASVAPTPVTALLHAVAVVNTGFFGVARLTWFSFGPELLKGSWAQGAAVLFSSFTMVFAAVMAVKQRHFKRRLAYSTVSNLSYMLFGATLMTPAGLLGGLSHMLYHGVIKMSMFLCAGAFVHVTGKEYIYEIDGIGRKMPFTFTAYTLGALSLTGIPLFCGFVSKWQLLNAGLDDHTVLGQIGVYALVLSAFLCAVYTLTVSTRAFFPVGPSEQTDGIQEAGWKMLAPIALFTALNVVFGIYPGPLTALLNRIAQGFF